MTSRSSRGEPRVCNRCQMSMTGEPQLAGLLPCECEGRHGGLRNRKTGFNSSAGCSEGYVLGVCRIARDFAEVAGQVRLLARTPATMVAVAAQTECKGMRL